MIVAVVRWLVVGCALLVLVFWWVVTQAGPSGLALLVHLPIVWSPASPSQNEQSYAVLGPPSVSAAFINRVLALYHSPAAGLGKALYDDGVSTGIEPMYALVFFMHESSFGTTAQARKS